jgi:hypothetical protein
MSCFDHRSIHNGLGFGKIQHKKMRALISEKLKLSIPKDNIYEVALRL